MVSSGKLSDFSPHAYATWLFTAQPITARIRSALDLEHKQHQKPDMWVTYQKEMTGPLLI
jgi:hypothetical protein